MNSTHRVMVPPQTGGSGGIQPAALGLGASGMPPPPNKPGAPLGRQPRGLASSGNFGNFGKDAAGMPTPLRGNDIPGSPFSGFGRKVMRSGPPPSRGSDTVA